MIFGGRYGFAFENFGWEGKMAKMIVLYKTPTDKDAFDKHYTETHIPLAKKIPGLQSYEISSGRVSAPGGNPGIHLVALLGFESFAALQTGLKSPEAAAATADVPNFATGGADILIFDTKEV